MLRLVPGEVLRSGPEAAVLVEVKRLAVAGGEALAMRGGFGETADGDVDQEAIALGDGGPEPLIEHPVGIRGEGEAVAGIVVAGDGVLVDEKRHKT